MFTRLTRWGGARGKLSATCAFPEFGHFNGPNAFSFSPTPSFNGPQFKTFEEQDRNFKKVGMVGPDRRTGENNINNILRRNLKVLPDTERRLIHTKKNLTSLWGKPCGTHFYRSRKQFYLFCKNTREVIVASPNSQIVQYVVGNNDINANILSILVIHVA